MPQAPRLLPPRRPRKEARVPRLDLLGEARARVRRPARAAAHRRARAPRAPQVPPRRRDAASRRHDPDRGLPSEPAEYEHREADEADVAWNLPAGPERVGALDAEVDAEAPRRRVDVRKQGAAEGRG